MGIEKLDQEKTNRVLPFYVQRRPVSLNPEGWSATAVWPWSCPRLRTIF